MKFKKLFSVPEGSRITEKSLYRVLISSICSILLCMGSLAGTTWAWYVVSVENTGNVIEIGTASVILTTQDLVPVSQNSYWPTQTDTTLHISHPNNYDDFNQKSTLYVTFSVDNTVKGYVMLNAGNMYESDLRILAGNGHQLTWVVSWFAPGTVAPLPADSSTNAYLINLMSEVETETEPPAESKDEVVKDNAFNESFDTVPDPSTDDNKEDQEAEQDQKKEEETTPTNETTQPSEQTTSEEQTTTDSVSTDGET